MSLINYQDIDFTQLTHKDNIILDFFGNTIEVVPYLSISDKYNIIMTVLSKSDEVDLYNQFKTKVYFDLQMVLMYSNIVVTEEEKKDEIVLYDTLKKSGLMDLVMNAIPEEEKNSLWEDILIIQNDMMQYRRSLSAIATTIIEKAPGIIEKGKELLTLFDEDKIKFLAELITQKHEVLKD